MALKYKTESIEEVEEQFRALYKQDENGVFMLDVEDNPYKAKIDEFRGNNNELKVQLEEKDKLLEAAKKAKEQALSVEKGEAQKVIDELNSQIASIKDELTTQLASKDEKLSAYEERERAKLEKILERLPEEARDKLGKIPDIDQALDLAELYDKNFASRREIPNPAIPGRLNTNEDLSKLTGAQKLAYYSKNQK